MKSLLLALSLCFISAASYANSGDATWKSSNTATVDTLKSLCGFGPAKALFHGVCVNDLGGSGLISVFNSRGVASLPVALIRSSAAVTSGCQFFDVQLSSGLTYSTSVANDNITFMYNCY